MSEEQAKKSEKKDKESPELKEELTEDELKGLLGGVMVARYEFLQAPPTLVIDEGIKHAE